MVEAWHLRHSEEARLRGVSEEESQDKVQGWVSGVEALAGYAVRTSDFILGAVVCAMV